MTTPNSDTKQLAVIFDIDGTLALNLGGRNIFDYSRCEEDSLNLPVFDVAHGMFLKGYELLFVSGREDACLVETTRWLGKHFPWYSQHISTNLFMRKHRDMRDDTIVKEEIYRQHIETKYEVRFVVDDRAKVVQMWRRIGLTCLQCAPGDFDKKWVLGEAVKLLCDNGYQVVHPPKPIKDGRKSRGERCNHCGAEYTEVRGIMCACCGGTSYTPL